MFFSLGSFSLEIPLDKTGGIKKRAAKKRAAKGRSRSSVQGATRKVDVAGRRPHRSTIWFNRGLILLGAVVVIAASVKAYMTLQSIPVQHISVTGELQQRQAEAVQELVQSSLAGGFLKADLQRIRTQLEDLPWIFEANIRRKWPSALEIHVVKQLPIARWGEHAFLNHKGGVFRSADSGDWNSLPRLLGPEGSAPALMAKYQRLIEVLAPLDLSVEQLALDEGGHLQAVLAGGLQLMLGSEDFLARMQRFVSIYRSELRTRSDTIERVDLRYESGMAVAFSAVPELTGL
jgi:cell division protein FtsQ